MTHPALVAPADTDWIVSVTKHGGELKRFRVSPGSLDPESAVKRAIRSAGLALSDVSEVTYCRAFEHLRVVTTDLDAQFRQLMDDARRRRECSEISS